MNSVEIKNLSEIKYPKKDEKIVRYGTAGFRTNADDMDFIAFRMGLLAALRAKQQKAVIGVMITASHNPVADNGIKLVDPKGEMLEALWEELASHLANAPNDEVKEEVENIAQKNNIDLDSEALVFVGRDTRPSSLRLKEAVENGVLCLKGKIKDFEVVSTPILHFVVACHNDGGKYGTPTELGYFQKISQHFLKLRQEGCEKGNYKPNILFDGANGVGAEKMLVLLQHLNETLKAEMYNREGVLNYMCGADHVKSSQNWPNGVPKIPHSRCVSVDGDADRVVYCYLGDDNEIHLLDGDKIATLVAGYIKQLMSKAGLDLQIGLIQTAYANGASTEYITSKLGVPVAFTKTGVKHLHHKAKEFDVGIYFESNGHGTVIFSDKARHAIEKGFEEGKYSAVIELYHAMSLTNEIVGDALSDMLLVESILLSQGWSAEDWDQSYTDLPNRLMKVTVADRTVITTTDAERKCLTPEGLQDAINDLVAKFAKGRSFVRPSGTEDIVRIYAEAATQKDCDELAYAVACVVYEKAGGVGNKPVNPAS